jgi:hypothetical protein
LNHDSATSLGTRRLIKNGCTGGALGPAHKKRGILCEDFDTDRNFTGDIELNRQVARVSICDPLYGLSDPDDDILGYSIDGGPVPSGMSGQRCSEDNGVAIDTFCDVVPSENDWHIHSPAEGCDLDDSYDGGDPNFALTCAPLPRAHSGLRSLHLGRHLRANDSNWDTYRFRQTSAFVLDPVHLGRNAELEFWHIMQVCDDSCVNLPPRDTTAGGQVQISVRGRVSGFYEPWQRLIPSANSYDATAQTSLPICEFDPGDDAFPGGDETMCKDDSPLWSNIGDTVGSDRTCTADTDSNDPDNLDCGRTDNRTVDATCSWVADPNCGSFLENGFVGPGVWARSRVDLAPFAGRDVRIRFAFEGGGGWGFGQSRSFLEPEPGFSPYPFSGDDGWYIDDIRINGVIRGGGACLHGRGKGCCARPTNQ